MVDEKFPETVHSNCCIIQVGSRPESPLLIGVALPDAGSRRRGAVVMMPSSYLAAFGYLGLARRWKRYAQVAYVGEQGILQMKETFAAVADGGEG